MTAALRILAGADAWRRIRAEGFHPDLFSMMVGASGGPKWLVLGGLDRALAGEWLPSRQAPLSLIGSSIGAWRFSCHAMSDPLAALERFESAYLGQRYSPRPSAGEVSEVSRGILSQLLGDDGAAQILSHPARRLAVMVARSRHLAARESRWIQGTGLAAAALANIASRRALGAFYARALFCDERDIDRYAVFGRHRHVLSAANLAEAVLASGSIPMVLEGVRDIPGAPRGVYRDGGVTDYHFDLEFAPSDGLVLYPHFYPRLTPGWFDKSLSWRRVSVQRLATTVILCPSDAFVAGLPGGRIPDREDFVRLTEDERVRCWSRVVGEARRLGDEFLDLVADGEPGSRLERLDEAG